MSPGNIERDHLSTGMDTGIGPTGAQNPDLSLGNARNSLL
jgi:hypothetical protein